jgi:hypothetical protein
MAKCTNHVVVQVAKNYKLWSVGIGDLDAELFLDCHDQLNAV